MPTPIYKTLTIYFFEAVAYCLYDRKQDAFTFYLAYHLILSSFLLKDRAFFNITPFVIHVTAAVLRTHPWFVKNFYRFM